MRMPRPLPDLLVRAGSLDASLLTTGQLEASGVSRHHRRRALSDGRIVQLAEGLFTTAERSADADAWELLRLRTAAFIRTAPSGAIAAGWSAMALHQLDSMTRPPPLPSVIRLRPGSSGSDRTAWGHTRYCLVPDHCVTRVETMQVLTPGFAVSDLARANGLLSCLMIADMVASTALGREQIGTAAAAMRRWPREPRASWIAQRCDGWAESPLETAGRYAAIRAGLPVPISNAWVGPGYPRARLDHWWPDQALAGEGDGAVKYKENPAAVMAAQLKRQHDLEQLGVRFVRYDWQLAVRQRPLLGDRFAAALAAPGASPSRELRWWTCEEGWAVIRDLTALERFPGRPVTLASFRGCVESSHQHGVGVEP